MEAIDRRGIQPREAAPRVGFARGIFPRVGIQTLASDYSMVAVDAGCSVAAPMPYLHMTWAWIFFHVFYTALECCLFLFVHRGVFLRGIVAVLPAGCCTLSDHPSPRHPLPHATRHSAAGYLLPAATPLAATPSAAMPPAARSHC